MFIFLLGIIFTLVLINLSKNFFEKYLLVVPSKRGINKYSIPQGGGIFFVIASFFHFNLIGIKLLAAIPLLLVSFLDDLFDISWKLRLSVQVFSSILLISNLQLFPVELNALVYFIYPLFILTTTSIINITNFMDGLDGLVGGTMFIVILAICFDLGLNLNFFLGALFGFLILNWAPAKIFMGDIGSNFLGFLFIALIMESKNIENIICYLLLIFPLLLDASSCLLRRILNEKNIKEIFKPHKKHLYQRMFNYGIEQYKITLLYSSATLFLCLNYIFYHNLKLLLINSFVIFCVGIILDKKYSIKFQD